ncbi:MAG: dTMP kinase [Candidatus Verstraetearchaeota archaeon]|nr:dTMP kinase [Candidatus Verstraetearchaeota archaeon]
MASLKRGAFIAIEGVDGAGSSTQTKLLVDWLVEKGYPAVSTKEPNPKGKVEPVIRYFLREPCPAPELDAILFAADRVDHVERFIKPWLKSKKIVVSDRYLESSIAYQSSQGLSERWVLSINRGAIPPDITIILDVDPTISLKRKGANTEKFENATFLSKVRAHFLERARRKGYCVIDASKSLEEVHLGVLKAVLPLVERISKRP